MPLIHHLLIAGRFNLFSPDQYHYLNQSGCFGDPSINDAQDFINVKVLYITLSTLMHAFTHAYVIVNKKSTFNHMAYC